MGLFDTIMGNASETSASDVQEELTPILAANETVTSAFKLVRDIIYRSYCSMIDRIVNDISHKGAVDFNVINI